jgi:hypothetical protein
MLRQNAAQQAIQYLVGNGMVAIIYKKPNKKLIID